MPQQKFQNSYKSQESSINKVLKPSKVQRQIRLRIYITLAIPILLYGSEAWTLKEQDKSRITAAEMKFMRTTAKYTWQDHERNQEITEELKIQPVMEKTNITRIIGSNIFV
jgi:hypothetical protein